VTPVELVLERLERVRRHGSGWIARCPAHEDKNPSLAVSEGRDERALLKCHAGCTVDAILAALGLEMSDLFPARGEGGSETPSALHATVQHPPPGCTLDAYAAAKRLPVEFLRSLGVAEITYLKQPAVRIPYLDTDGVEDAVRFRVALDGDDKFRWKAGTKAQGKLYGLSRLARARELGYTLLVEGESDAQTAWLHERPAVALPGAAMWSEPVNAPQLDGVDAIYVLIEPDKGGEAMLNWLRGSAIRERVRLVRLDTAKDLSELHLADETRFGERLEAALQRARPWGEHERIAGDLRREAAWGACAQLALDPRILDRLGEAIISKGLVGEEAAAKIVYLAVTSRLFGHPTSVVVKGPSAGGKSYVVETMLGFFPPESYYSLTGMSEHALAYSSESLVHRHLVLYEASAVGAEFADYLLRTLLSEGQLRYETVEKTSSGLQARLIERPGPTGLVLTTTAVSLHPENETRLLSVTISDSVEQTAAIFRALAEEDDRPAVDLEPWVALQAWIAGGRCEVSVPFARFLAELVPPKAVRLRRDFRALLNLVRAHALLHQANRELDAKRRIVATIDDYAAARELVADLLAEGVEATVPATVRETVEAVAAADGEALSLAQLAATLKLDKSAASRRWREARRRGYLKNLEDKRGKPARIVVDEPLPEDVELLPPPELVAECCSVACNTEGVADPPPPRRDT
jgi:hypothetical protein